MNYYERHLGDYAKDTAHLSLLEHGAYTILLDRYYATESGIPSDQAHRVTRARTREEKSAVDAVLEEFFELVDGVWISKRCEDEIAQFKESEPDREAKRENERERQRRARERRRQIFDTLREHGIVPAYDAPMSELNTLLERVKSQGVTQPVTRDVTATQTPDTSTPEVNPPIPPKGGRAAIEFKTFVAECKTKGERLISGYKPVFDYAESIKLPQEFVELCWAEFYRRHQPGGVSEAKRYKDWRKAFRNCLEGNWYKLWWLNGDAYELTTAGKTAQKAAA